MSKNLKIGDEFPDFCLPDQDANTCCTKDYLGQNMVIYFYPKDETKICTAEACGFNNHLSMFNNLEAVVLGISSDSIQSHQFFHSKYKLDFKLLSDQDSKIRKQVGAIKFMIPLRITYVVDKSGKVVLIVNSMFQAEKHVQLSLKKLKEISAL